MDRAALNVEPFMPIDEPATSHSIVPRHSRRLSDKILVAFHHACDVPNQWSAETPARTSSPDVFGS